MSLVVKWRIEHRKSKKKKNLFGEVNTKDYLCKK